MDLRGVSRRDLLRGGFAAASTAAVGGGALWATSSRRPRRQADPATCPLEHLVLVMMENRSFDHLLGRHPGAAGITADMACAGDDGARTYVHRQRDMTCTIGDLPHGFADGIDCWNGGANDGFVRSNGPQSMGYMSPLEVPWIYALAREYAVFDRWHCSLLAGTWPNRRYALAGTTNGSREDTFDSPLGLGYAGRTLLHQLSDAGVSWGVYFTDVPFPALYPDLVLRYGSNFRPMSRFHTDAAAGLLPQVVMVEPGYLIGTDDHPPRNTQLGQRFMHDVVKSLLYSPSWPRTACVLTYDEWGGFFDHVPPPVLEDDPPEMGRPAGFRVPGIVVSPWARRGVVSSGVKDHTSWLRFVQWRFGLPPLSVRNAAAANLLEVFDFDAPVRTDVPDLAMPEVDAALSSWCWLGDHMRPAADYHFAMPGGEGPESPQAWAQGEAPGGGARPVGADAPSGADVDVDAAYRAAQAVTLDGPAFLDAVARAGGVPRELDLRPRRDGESVRSPYLDPAGLPSAPLWLAQGVG